MFRKRLIILQVGLFLHVKALEALAPAINV